MYGWQVPFASDVQLVASSASGPVWPLATSDAASITLDQTRQREPMRPAMETACDDRPGLESARRVGLFEFLLLCREITREVPCLTDASQTAPNRARITALVADYSSHTSSSLPPCQADTVWEMLVGAVCVRGVPGGEA